MSRLKSKATLQRERDRELRRKRRDLKHQEREKRIAYRTEKKRRHELVKNGGGVRVADYHDFDSLTTAMIQVRKEIQQDEINQIIKEKLGESYDFDNGELLYRGDPIQGRINQEEEKILEKTTSQKRRQVLGKDEMLEGEHGRGDQGTISPSGSEQGKLFD